MAIASYLDDLDVDPETKRVLDVALEMTRTALGLADDFANGIIAKQIVELASMKTAIKPAVESHHLHTIDLRRRAGDR